MLFELEKERSEDIWEYSTTLLLEKEFGRFIATANLGLTDEWGGDSKDELESTVALQGRYRYSPHFEPAMKLYVGQDTQGLEPVIMGMERLGIMKAIRWELGVIFGVDNVSPDYTVRAVPEYEFQELIT